MGGGGREDTRGEGETQKMWLSTDRGGGGVGGVEVN